MARGNGLNGSALVMVVYSYDAIGQELEYDPPVLLERYDPEYADGRGYAWFTRDPAKAQRFASWFEALNTYEAVPKSRPVREDGQPNKPLGSFSVEFLPLRQACEICRIKLSG